MKYIITSLFVLVTCTIHAQFGKYFENKTCRVDYFHSGDAYDEYYELDEVILENKWFGSRKNLIDDFDYGNYKFNVLDSTSGKLIYSKTYSSLFLEYRSTEEAKNQCGNYTESVVFPLPKETFIVEFYSRGKDLVWSKKHEILINPADPNAIRENNRSSTLYTVHFSGKPKKKLDIAFVPEGYTRDQMQKFRSDCDKFAKYILECEPYNDFRKKINIWGIVAPSEEEGTDLPGDSIWKNTLLNTNFYTFGSERYLTTSDYKTVRDAVSGVPADFIVILVNHEKYGGGGIFNFYCVATTDNEYSDFLLVHELGHSFAGLGDEYYTSEVAVQDFYDLSREPWEPNLTSLVDFGSKWESMLPSGTPVPTPDTEEYRNQIGVFEGGGYVAKGIYRPYIDCTMNVRKYNNFCPVCSKAIEEMIRFYSK